MRRLFALLFVASMAAAHASSPSALHLNSPVDREAFRRWFTFLTESQFYAPKPQPDVKDCAALVRFALREAIAPHDAAWANALELPLLPVIPPVHQFTYPRTPVGANLFRTGDNTAGQFADATALRKFNCFFVSRELREAVPGDLLFYRQFDRAMPAHVMVFVGPSQFERSNRRWIVYHTGPSGEVRKVALEDLLAHPAPEWRPESGNSNFLGVWRLNLLRESE